MSQEENNLNDLQDIASRLPGEATVTLVEPATTDTAIGPLFDYTEDAKEIPGLRECFMQMGSLQNQFVAMLLQAHELCKKNGLLMDIAFPEKHVPLGQHGGLINTVKPEFWDATNKKIAAAYEKAEKDIAARPEQVPMTYKHVPVEEPAQQDDYMKNRTVAEGSNTGGNAPVPTDLKTSPELLEALVAANPNKVQVRSIGVDVSECKIVIASSDTPMPPAEPEADFLGAVMDAGKGAMATFAEVFPAVRDVLENIVPMPEPMPAPKQYNKVGKALIEVLTRNLPQSLIAGGVGNDIHFDRYKADAAVAPQDYLMKWPTGIYHSTMGNATQLLLRIMDPIEKTRVRCVIMVPNLFTLRDVSGTAMTREISSENQARILFVSQDGSVCVINDDTPDTVYKQLMEPFVLLAEQYLASLR